MQKYRLIAAGGALGAIARYWVGAAVTNRVGVRFPYGTLIVNITACVIIGFSLTYLGRRADLNPAWRYFIPIGFIGAYSTFSTYEWETLSALRSAPSFWRFSTRAQASSSDSQPSGADLCWQISSSKPWAACDQRATETLHITEFVLDESGWKKSNKG